MKKHWQERLLKIEDLKERRLLRSVLMTAFSDLDDYTNEQLEAIKQRVFEESKPESNQFSIFTSLVAINDYNPINDFLFPMNEDDLKELPFDATVIMDVNESGAKPILGKLYFELDHLKLQEIKKTLLNRKFKGQLRTSREVYEIEVSLIPYEGYKKQVERLYELYLANNIPWQTILHPSIHKFVTMQLETNIAFKKHEKIEEISIDLEELEPYKQINQIPLWNIKTEPFKSQDFPMSSGDRTNYEHVINLKKAVREIGYLIDNGLENNSEMNIRMEAERLIVMTPEDDISSWKLWMIVTPLEIDLEKPRLLSNRKIESFIEHFASRSGRPVRTLGEVYRMANVFADVSDLKLIDVEINAPKDTTFETYELNPFVKDEIRYDDDKKIMKLTFKAEQITPFTRDMMSFLTSEIALSFPELKCMGEVK